MRGREAMMSSLLERLEQREAAARGRVEALRAELATLAERLAAEEALLGRLEITKATVLEVLAGDGDALGEEAAARGAAATAPAPGSGMAVGVPAFSANGDATGRELPVAYRDVVEVLVDAGEPLRAKQLCVALGAGTEPRHVEGMRSRLKRLVRRSWLVEVEPGLFALAQGVADGQLKARGSSS
jgi:hypothetical protein